MQPKSGFDTSERAEPGPRLDSHLREAILDIIRNDRLSIQAKSKQLFALAEFRGLFTELLAEEAPDLDPAVVMELGDEGGLAVQCFEGFLQLIETPESIERVDIPAGADLAAIVEEASGPLAEAEVQDREPAQHRRPVKRRSAGSRSAR